MALFLAGTLLLITGLLAWAKPIHQILAKKPLLGLASIALIGVIIMFVYGFVWQVLSCYVFVLVMLLEYLALVIVKNQKLRITYKLNQKLWIFMAYVTGISLFLFPLPLSINQARLSNDIGTWKVVVESSNRSENFASVEGVKRRFTLNLYYPILSDSGKEKLWLDGSKDLKGLAMSYGLPEMLLGHLKRIPSDVIWSRKIKVPDAPYPVVIISHGSKSSHEQFEALAKQLADQGCFVAVINHPYSAYATVFDEKNAILGAKSMAAQLDYVDQKVELEKQMTIAQQGDLIETFKVLEDINSGRYDEKFRKQLDLSDMTLVGHQLGGGSVLVTLNQFPFIRSAILLNPIVEQLPKKYAIEGSAKPVVALLTKDYLKSNNAGYFMRYLSGCKEAYAFSANTGKDLDLLELTSITPLFKWKGLSEGKRSSEKLQKAKYVLCAQTVKKYSQGHLFEEFMSGIDVKTLGLSPLKPEEVDGK